MNGFRLILGHFAYPSAYEGRPFADVLASATTATEAAVAVAATAPKILIRTQP